MDILKLINRKKHMFIDDLNDLDKDLIIKIRKSSFLVLGGAGSIGQSVVKEIFKRNPKIICC